jgi:hypothetical protein
MVCAIKAEWVISFLIGVASSTIVAIIFYWLSRRDSESLSRISQLDSVLLRLKELTPLAWNNSRGQNGVGDTHHWLICMSEVMKETGFEEGGKLLTTIVEEMLQGCSGPNEVAKISAQEAEKKKKTWEAKTHALQSRQPLTFLNSIGRNKAKSL